MVHEQERYHMREILGDPESAAPRLAYASWLEEQGDVRAEAVRVGVEVKQRQWERLDNVGVDLRLEELERRQKNLNVDYSRKCREQLPQIKGVNWERFEGGVIERVTIEKAQAFRKHAGAILDAQPVHQFLCALPSRNDKLATVLSAPELARLGALYMGGNYDGPAVARALAASPHIANLRCLSLGYTTIGEEGARHLAGARHLDGLVYLVLTRNELGEAGLRELCQSPCFSSLERLLLGNNDLGPNAAAILAKYPLANLRWLSLESNSLGPGGLIALVETGRVAQIEWLDLGWCALEDQDANALFGADCSRLAQVSLYGNKIAAPACAALAANRLPAIRELRLELAGKASKKVAASFAQAEWWPQVEKLSLRGTAWPSLGRELAQARLDKLEQLSVLCFTDPKAPAATFEESVELLAANPTLGALRLLELHMPLSERALEHLSQLKSLRQLMIPQGLDDQSKLLKASLPKCKVTRTGYTF